jgi:hypothetical protein
MIPLTEGQPRRAMLDGSQEADSAEAALSVLRPLLVRGHVFAVDDAVTGRTAAGKQNRPAVIVIVSPLNDRAAVALQQRVAVSVRRSWKVEWGTPGSLEAEAFLERGKLVFSPRHSLKPFNKDGVFELNERYTIKVADLLRCKPLGWLPRPAIDAILAHAGARLPDPYPPGE